MTSLNEPKRTFGHSHLSVDCVVLGFDGDNIRVLLLKRNDFELHDMKLPGDIIYADETLDEAARRVIRDYTGMKDLEMVQFQTFSSIDRIDDPRDVYWLESYLQEKVTRVVTAAYFSIMRISKFAAYKNQEFVWMPVDELPQLAFDHNLIIESALDYFAKIATLDNDCFFQLLPRKFTILQLRKLYERVFQTKIDPGNFYKKVAQMPHVIPLDEKEQGQRHRSARYFKYDKKATRSSNL